MVHEGTFELNSVIHRFNPEERAQQPETPSLDDQLGELLDLIDSL
jgi:hypothetical protein